MFYEIQCSEEEHLALGNIVTIRNITSSDAEFMAEPKILVYT